MLLKKTDFLLEDPLKTLRQAVRHQLGPVEPQQRNVKDARRSQSVKIAGILIRDHVAGDVVATRMQDAPTMSQISAVRPEIPFVLIAPNTGIDQVVLVVTSTPFGPGARRPFRFASGMLREGETACCSRPIMIEGKLAAHRNLGYTAVAASSLKALSNSFK